MKRVLVLGLSNTGGGVENVILKFYRAIDKTKIQFDFLTVVDNPSYRQEIESMGGKIYRITGRGENIYKFHKECKKFFKDHAKEYCAIWYNTCMLSNLYYLKYAKKYGIKNRMIHAHVSHRITGLIHIIMHNINKTFVGKYATHFWSCSIEASRYTYPDKIVKSDKHCIINNAIDTELFKYDQSYRNNIRKELQIYPNTIVFGHVGRLSAEKNQSFVIDIFNEYHKKNNNSKLLIVGDGKDRDALISKSSKLGLGKDILFLGARDDVNQLYSAMDIFVFPSLFESFGLSLLEAECSGLTCYASGNIPDDACVINTTKLSLDKSASEWAEYIIENTTSIDRENCYKTISNAGFDINKEAKKLEKYFTKGE